MEGPSAVIALVLAETSAGATALLWLTRLWGSVKRGYFILTGAVALGCGLLATQSASGAVTAPGLSGTVAEATGAERLAVILSAGASVLLATSLVALVLRVDWAGRALGLVAVVASVATLVGFARIAGPSFGLALVHLLAGAAFMGAVTDGLLLGHWYLTDRRLPREHIQRHALLLIVAVAVEAVAVLLLGFGATETGPGFNPVLAVAGLATWLALGMVVCTALIAFLIRASLRSPRTRSVQAATGFFYLAVITAFTAEMAAKVRFLG
jgi:hypothetical protein